MKLLCATEVTSLRVSDKASVLAVAVITAKMIKSKETTIAINLFIIIILSIKTDKFF